MSYSSHICLGTEIDLLLQISYMYPMFLCFTDERNKLVSLANIDSQTRVSNCFP